MAQALRQDRAALAAQNNQLSADLWPSTGSNTCSCPASARIAPPSRRSAPVDERVLAACHLISQDLQRSASVNEIATEVCLSPSRLSHLFRKHLGMGVIQWRECQRLQYAKQLLRVTNVPIKSLSQMVGYDDPAVFLAGVPPSGRHEPLLFPGAQSIGTDDAARMPEAGAEALRLATEAEDARERRADI